MTEKRYNVFKNRIGNRIVEDNVDDKYLLNIPKFFGFDDEESANVFCNELNLLHEENEQLKQQLQSILKLTRKIEDCTHDIKLIGDVE